MNKKLKVVFGGFIILLGIWLSASSIEDFLNPIKFVSEVTAQSEDYVNRNVQVAGLIVKETLEKGEEPNSYFFDLTDGKSTIKVRYRGSDPIPDVKPGVGVTVIGTLSPDGTLTSNKVLFKCPSKYQEELDKVYQQEKSAVYSGGAYIGA
jgi:cytochrome c-type biogenesis protein CcmE